MHLALIDRFGVVSAAWDDTEPKDVDQSRLIGDLVQYSGAPRARQGMRYVSGEFVPVAAAPLQQLPAVRVSSSVLQRQEPTAVVDLTQARVPVAVHSTPAPRVDPTPEQAVALAEIAAAAHRRQATLPPDQVEAFAELVTREAVGRIMSASLPDLVQAKTRLLEWIGGSQ